MALKRRSRAAPSEFFPGFTDVVEIGMGSLSTVFRARELSTNRYVALKLLNIRDASPRALESFERESVALGAVSSHPNIVTLFRSFRAGDGRPVLVLELCQGSMADRVRGGPGLPAPEVVALGVKIAGALETAHRAEILHRDVKPQNILVTEYGEPALADFGVAMLQSSTQTTAGLFDFTTLHAAPELLEGGDTSAATDVYELASSLYQLVAGRSAFRAYDGESPAAVILRILRDPVQPLRAAEVPSQLSDLLIYAMSKDKENRPPTAAEFAEELAAIEAAHGWPRTQFLIRDPRVPGGGLPGLPSVRRMPEPRRREQQPVPAPPPAYPPVYLPPPAPERPVAPQSTRPPTVVVPRFPPPGARPAVAPQAAWPVPAPAPSTNQLPVQPSPAPAAATTWSPPAGGQAPARGIEDEGWSTPTLSGQQRTPAIDSVGVEAVPEPAKAEAEVPEAEVPEAEVPEAQVSETQVPEAQPDVVEAEVVAAADPEIGADGPAPVVPRADAVVIEHQVVQRMVVDLPPGLRDWAASFADGRLVGAPELPAGSDGDLAAPPHPDPAVAGPVDADTSSRSIWESVPDLPPQPPGPDASHFVDVPPGTATPEAQVDATPVGPAAFGPGGDVPVSDAMPRPIVPWREAGPAADMAPPGPAGPPPLQAPPGFPGVPPLGGEPDPGRTRERPFPIPPSAASSSFEGAAVPTWAQRGVSPNGQPPPRYSDLRLDPMALRPSVSFRAGAAGLVVDEQRLQLRTWLRRSDLPWSDVLGFEQRVAPSGAEGSLVAITHSGPVELPATHRPLAELRSLHALLDAYRVRAAMTGHR